MSANESGFSEDAPPFKLNVVGANIRRTNLSYTNLSGADLTDANCSFVNFRGANFKNAKLIRTKLIGAILTDAKNLTKAQIEEAIIDDTTKLPGYLLAEMRN
jgi:uncharacterized protein YjbI with pentapeptide repeats